MDRDKSTHFFMADRHSDSGVRVIWSTDGFEKQGFMSSMTFINVRQTRIWDRKLL